MLCLFPSPSHIRCSRSSTELRFQQFQQIVLFFLYKSVTIWPVEMPARQNATGRGSCRLIGLQCRYQAEGLIEVIEINSSFSFSTSSRFATACTMLVSTAHSAAFCGRLHLVHGECGFSSSARRQRMWLRALSCSAILLLIDDHSLTQGNTGQGRHSSVVGDNHRCHRGVHPFYIRCTYPCPPPCSRYCFFSCAEIFSNYAL